MNLPDGFPRLHDVAVLAAALALTLPAPPVPGVPGTPGTDALRAGQARRTAVGLEELPRTLGQTPDTAPAGGLEEAEEEFTLMVVSTTVEDGSLPKAVADSLSAWGTLYERHYPEHRVTFWWVTPDDLADMEIHAAPRGGRPPDLIMAVAPTGPEASGAAPAQAAAWADQVIRSRRTHPWLLRAPLHLIAIASPATREAVDHQLQALPMGDDGLATRLVVEDTRSGWLPRYLTGQLSLALDRRHGGLPEGRIFNPKTQEFSVLVKALGMTMPSADDAAALWQLEEVVRRAVLGMDVTELKALKAGLVNVLAGGSGETVPTSWAQAVVSATNELNQLQTRAALVEFFRALRETQAKGWPVSDGKEGRDFVSHDSRSIMFGRAPYLVVAMAVDDIPGRLPVTIRRQDGALLNAWEQSLIQRFAVRIQDRAAGTMTKPKQFESVNQRADLAFILAIDLDVPSAALGETNLGERIHLIVAGPGLPEAGLEEATVEQTTRTEADPALEQYY